MKRIISAASLLFLFLMPIFAVAQTIVENPSKPDNPRAGRVVTLEEVMRIEDTGKDFYIKNLTGLAVGSDGSVFVQDEHKQLLQFDPRGRFVRNLMKTGQGPGEMPALVSFLVAGGQIALYGNSRKVVIRDFEGGLVQEISLQAITGTLTDFVTFSPAFLTFNRHIAPTPGHGDGWVSFSNELVSISRRTSQSEVLADFPIPAYAHATSDGRMEYHLFGRLRTHSLNPDMLAVAHTAEYSVKVFNLADRKVETSFRRTYKRIKRTASAGGVSGMGASSIKTPEYDNDISRIHHRDGRLWIQTSAADEDKGILFDVFDPSGRYLDCIFLKFKAGKTRSTEAFKRFVFSGGFVYFDDRTEDDLVVIRKCRMIGL